MADILSRRTSLHVNQAVDSDRLIAAAVYMAPPLFAQSVPENYLQLLIGIMDKDRESRRILLSICPQHS